MASEKLPQMQYRFLGRSGLQVSAVSLGGWITYGGHVKSGEKKALIGWRPMLIDAEGSFACLKAAYDAGINFFDCAENYSAGESEKMMGEAIKHFGWKRNDLVHMTATGTEWTTND